MEGCLQEVVHSGLDRIRCEGRGEDQGKNRGNLYGERDLAAE
jgi:hypothetical protein